jgi:hypothetical protein
MTRHRLILTIGLALAAGTTLAEPVSAQQGVVSLGDAQYLGTRIVAGNTWAFRTCKGNIIKPEQYPAAKFAATSQRCPSSASASSGLDADAEDPGKEARDAAKAQAKAQADELKSIQSQPH